jgi:hypothetical protein
MKRFIFKMSMKTSWSSSDIFTFSVVSTTAMEAIKRGYIIYRKEKYRSETPEVLLVERGEVVYV